MGWSRVSRHEPCPVCGRQDYCTRTLDGTAVKCMRVKSAKQVIDKGGGVGWIHSLTNPLPPLPPPKPVVVKADWTEECKAMFQHKKACQKRHEVAEKLSVSVKSLEMLRVGIGWDEWNGAEFSSWPSRDSAGRCIGYLRRYSDGSKRTNQGGSTGLFYTPGWLRNSGPLWIVEGGSDVAACESAGLAAIGRASNTYGGGWIRKMIEGSSTKKRVFVVGERDEAPDRRGLTAGCPKDCDGCALCWPGLFGAKRVAAELSVSWVMVSKPYKDMRELLTSGGLWLDLMRLL